MNQRILLSIIAVTGALLFSSYGYAESQAQKKGSSSVEQPPQMQLSNKTTQTISFKGIPLGKPGVKNALQKICMGKKFNSMKDRCSFTDEKSMILLDYESLVDAIALVTLSSDKALIKVVIDGSTQEMLALAKALEKKYGKPLKQNAIVKKAIGTQLDQGTFGLKEVEGFQLDKETFIWVDNQGSRITVESIYSDYDKGGVAIESSASVAAQDSAEKSAIEPGKPNP
ncbi:MAG: hypothetical protein A3H31_03075 [Gallionellales bacterium RIFCSPLOWO2_02_FULL_57_47]|nr:MAG: hypothetical protein A3H31_03075 [Gallionellales bacterium RIFCSPLOWO2_02_FULL_57_47]OGT18279.1 MAG: hypothetical protein A3J49_03680 [Gallionellales bacterium RIFCSPHIGHO2_02_FULL_57_16]